MVSHPVGRIVAGSTPVLTTAVTWLR